MKQLPFSLKIVKAIEMWKLQQQMTVLRTQQQQCEEKVEELQAEVERVTGIIQLVHKKVCEVEELVEKVMPEHVSFDLLEHMQKTKEEVRTEAEKLVKLVEDFHNKISTRMYMEQ